MRKHLGLFTAGAAALALTLGIGPALQSAQAEYFEYDGTLTVSNVTGATVSGSGNSTVTLTTPGGDTIVLNVTPSSNPTYHTNALPGTDIVFSTITANTTPNTTAQSVGFDFTYSINITDYAQETTGASNPALGTGTFDISGRLSGSIGAGRAVSLNQLTGYAVNPTSQVIGSALYTVTKGNGFFTAPGVDNNGTFGVFVQAKAVPEPVSVISTALGFLGLGGFLVNNRRRNRKAQAA